MLLECSRPCRQIGSVRFCFFVDSGPCFFYPLSPSLPLTFFALLPSGGSASRVFSVKPPPGSRSPAPFGFHFVSDLMPRFMPPPGRRRLVRHGVKHVASHISGVCPACLCGSDPPSSPHLWRLGGGGDSAGSFPGLLTFLRQRHRRMSRIQQLLRKCGLTTPFAFCARMNQKGWCSRDSDILLSDFRARGGER